MIPQFHPSPPRHSPKAGFALIASLSIMAVLVMIAVALYSMSSVATQSAKIASARIEAQANAKVALMQAIGELQKTTGPDARITAPANLIAPDATAIVGVWKSWEGLNHDPDTGQPITPDYGLKVVTDTSPNARFLSWLVSGDREDSDGNLVSPFDLVSEEPTTNANGTTIPLLSDGSLLSSDTRQIHVVPTESEDSGRFAWWVSPENQKARLTQPHEPRTDDVAGWVETGQSHLVTDPSVFGLDTLIDNPESFNTNTGTRGPVNKAVTRDTLALFDAANSAEPDKRFHDLSTSAVGLLTNTATGGWRKDLSLLTEKWDDIYTSYPGGELPLFRYAPISGATSAVPKPTSSNYDPEQSNLYPWSDYSIILGNKNPATYHAASASWASLFSFATSYKNFSYNEGMVESPFVWDAINSANDEKFFKYKHTQRLYPQIARFQFLVYAQARAYPNREDRYNLYLKYVPIVTLWNPYNIRLTIDNPGPPTSAVVLGGGRAIPGALAVVRQSQYPNPDDVPGNQYRLLTRGNFTYLDGGRDKYDTELQENIDRFNPGGRGANHWIDMRTWAATLPTGGQITFDPGEAIMFSPDGRIERRYGGTAFGMEHGYQPEAVEGFEFRIAGWLTEEEMFWFLLRTDKYTQPYRSRDPGVGFTLSYGMRHGGSYTGGDLYVLPSQFHNITSLANGDLAEDYWPQSEVDEVGYSIAELASGPAIPLFSISMGPRTTIGTGVGTAQNRPTKGLVQSDPLAATTIVAPADDGAENHPVNGNFDMSYHSLSLGSTITPNLSESEGYIATGYQSGDGLSRIIMADIPLRPMASLVELQAWNPRGNNPYPPFQMNLIGNSDATPLIPNNDIVPPTLNPSKTEFNLLHDDAYCANHLLFDDWFVSSIAPHPQVLGGNIAKDMKTVYEEFLKGDLQLSNRAYKPIAADRNLSTSDASARADSILNRPDGFLKVASRLEVEGMFNVNSTSVDAWKALLGHAKSIAEIGLHGEDTIESVSPSNSHAVTRGAVASDVEAGTAPAVGGQFPNASEYTGFRNLTDNQIEDLAEKIVEQVRRRGPFLSLAEFVNRQLSTNDNLALAGAVQSAINNLDEDPMKELRDPANMLSDTTMPESDPKLDGVDYEFSKAAEGSSAYGAPAWIRQADVLRPIAPILSARDDTFTIRAYGDSLDQSGAIVSRAWCEAVVKRTRNFCDPSDPADSIEPPVSPTNIRFGRKYEIVAFRWLSPDEV